MVEVYLNNGNRPSEMTTAQLEDQMSIWRKQGRSVDLYAHESERGFSIGPPRFRVIVVPFHSIIESESARWMDG